MIRRISCALVCLVVLSVAAPPAEAQQPKPMTVKLIEPTSLPRGQTTTIRVVAVGLPDVQSAVVFPPFGTKVVEITKGPAGEGGTGEVGIVIAVDADAQPGQRALRISSPGWDLELTKVRIQDHNLRIADLKAEAPVEGMPPDHSGAGRHFAFTLFDDKADVFESDARLIGDVTALTTCGGKALKVAGRDMDSYGVSGTASPSTAGAQETVPVQQVRRAKDPDPKAGPPPDLPKALTQGGATTLASGSRGMAVSFTLPAWAGTGACEIRLSVTDKAGNESNVLRLKADLKTP